MISQKTSRFLKHRKRAEELATITDLSEKLVKEHPGSARALMNREEEDTQLSHAGRLLERLVDLNVRVDKTVTDRIQALFPSSNQELMDVINNSLILSTRTLVDTLRLEACDPEEEVIPDGPHRVYVRTLSLTRAQLSAVEAYLEAREFHPKEMETWRVMSTGLEEEDLVHIRYVGTTKRTGYIRLQEDYAERTCGLYAVFTAAVASLGPEMGAEWRVHYFPAAELPPGSIPADVDLNERLVIALFDWRCLLNQQVGFLSADKLVVAIQR